MSTGSPRKVFACVAIAEFSQVDAVQSSAWIDVVIKARWSASAGDQWRPQFFLLNAVESDMAYVTMVDATHSVDTHDLHVRMVGRIAVFWDLQPFPFDMLPLQLQIECRGQPSEEVQLCWCQTGNMGKLALTWQEAVQFDFPRTTRGRLAEWTLRAIELEADSINFGHAKYDALVLTAYLWRRPGFYFMKIFFLVGLVSLCGLTAFELEVDDIANRVNLITTCLLAQAAMLLTISTALPRVSFQTTADSFINASFGFLGVMLVASWAAHRAARDDLFVAEAINEACYRLLPIAYLTGVLLILGPHIMRHMRVVRSTVCLPEDNGPSTFDAAATNGRVQHIRNGPAAGRGVLPALIGAGPRVGDMFIVV